MKLKKIILIIAIMMFPFNVFANSLECPKVAVSGEEITCYLKLDNIAGVSANYSLGNNFTYLSMSVNDSWKVYYQDGKGFSLGNITDSKGLGASIKLKVANGLEVNKDYSVGINNINTTDTNSTLTKLENIQTSVKVVSDNSYLKTLSLNNMKFTKTFKKDNYVYYAQTVEGETVISAVAEDSGATISGDVGKQKLNYGVNSFVIRVTSAYGHSREYKIYITRINDKNVSKDALSSDAFLKSITLSYGKIDFNKDKFLYELFVENQVDTIEVKAVANNSKALIDVEKPDKLEVGENQIVITVTAEDKTQCKYVLLITREDIDIVDEENDITNKKDEDKVKFKSIFKIIIYIVVILLLLILIKVVKSMIKFIKNNRN